MDNYLTICDKCVEDMKNVTYTSPMQFRGYFATYKVPEDMVCPKCKSKLRTTSITIDDYKIIFAISHDTNFIQAMMDLKEKDIIEYQLKLSQFKAQIENNKQTQQQIQQQAKIQKQSEVNIPKCPTCGSTNIQKISGLSKAGSVALWGIFSRKVHKQWHCNECGSEW